MSKRKRKSLSPPSEKVRPQTVDYEKAARFLFDLLDDIDTASDRAKADDKAYRAIVERIQRRRFEVASTDGYAVTFFAQGNDEVSL